MVGHERAALHDAGPVERIVVGDHLHQGSSAAQHGLVEAVALAPVRLGHPVVDGSAGGEALQEGGSAVVAPAVDDHDLLVILAPGDEARQ